MADMVSKNLDIVCATIRVAGDGDYYIGLAYFTAL
jgi:hypothetical protein